MVTIIMIIILILTSATLCFVVVFSPERKSKFARLTYLDSIRSWDEMSFVKQK